MRSASTQSLKAAASVCGHRGFTPSCAGAAVTLAPFYWRAAVLRVARKCQSAASAGRLDLLHVHDEM